MIIRKYVEGDCAALADLFYNTVHTINKKDYSFEELNAWANGEVDINRWNSEFLSHCTWVAQCGDTICGFADMDDQGYLDRLYVHKDYQGRGIAAMLVARLEACGLENGIRHYETFSSITARGFFLRMGYVVERENTVVRGGVTLKNYLMTKTY